MQQLSSAVGNRKSEAPKRILSASKRRNTPATEEVYKKSQHVLFSTKRRHKRSKSQYLRRLQMDVQLPVIQTLVGGQPSRVCGRLRL